MKLWLSLVVAIFISMPTLAAAKDFEKSVVLVHISKQLTDYGSPWRKLEVENQLYIGTAILPDRILTTAQGLADAKLIEGQRIGQSKKVPLRIVFLDYETNLALLAPQEKQDLQGLTPVKLGDEVALFSDLKIFHSRNSLKLNEQTTGLKQVTLQGGQTSPYLIPYYGLESSKTSGFGWGEPVIKDGLLVGITSGQEKNIIYAIPAPIIRHFLEDRHDETYRGFPFLGVTTQALLSPYYRALLGAKKFPGGVRVAKVLESSSFLGVLQNNDIIIQVESTELDDQGYFSHPKWGRIYLSYLVNRKYAGDSLKLKVVRGGEVKVLSTKLQRFDRNRTLVPFSRPDQEEPHLVFGGFVFQELSRPYLMSWGKKWEKNIPYDFSYIFNFRNLPPKVSGDRVVILNRVLGDEYNRGYENFGQAVLAQVNSQKVASIAQLRAILKDRPQVRGGKRYATFSLTRGGGELVLPYEGIEKSNARIAENYGVNTPDSFYHDDKRAADSNDKH